MRIHIIGIGGIGVSALAKYFLSQGTRVSGSDLSPSEITEELTQAGMTVMIGRHKKTNIPRGVHRVIYSSAVTAQNPELQDAKHRNIKTESYPEALGALTRKFNTITVSGAHGKSTTTSLLAYMFEQGHFDPTVIVGTKIKEFGNSNFRRGQGTHLILEADEWNRSFLSYHPAHAIVTNIDAEHLDTYGHIDNIKHTFEEYLRKIPKKGIIVLNYDDPHLRAIAERLGRKVIWYSFRDREATRIRSLLKIPGAHNISNALAALKMARALGVQETHILAALARFSGAWRRFELKGIMNGAFLFSDYAHHPREISSTIAAARERFPFRRIWCVFQPHQYQRLSYLWDDFTAAFDHADRICLLPVYDVAGRETASARRNVNSKKLASVLDARGKHVIHFSSHVSAKKYIRSSARKGDVILFMGAGDIYRLANELSSLSCNKKR